MLPELPSTLEVMSLTTARIGEVDRSLMSMPPGYRVKWSDGTVSNVRQSDVRKVSDDLYKLVSNIYVEMDTNTVTFALHAHIVHLIVELAKYEGLKDRITSVIGIENQEYYNG